MKSRAAVLWEQPGKWDVIDVDLDEPEFGEVLVEMSAAGLCHTDDHMATGDIPVGHLPFCGGHEGAGVVRSVGAGVSGLAEGDHIVTSFVPACGRCTWCASGRQHLCDSGAGMLIGAQLDGTFRMRSEGTAIATNGMLGTFASCQIFDQTSVIKIPTDVPLDVACLISCGVPTGWGSATNAAAITPGDTVIVIGVGGVGVSAVQGARFVGAGHVIAVDPVEFKREKALELGATAAFESIGAAADFARSVTGGQGANAAIITVGVLQAEQITEALAAIGKAGTVVVTSAGSYLSANLNISLLDLVMFAKRIQGVIFGLESPRALIPRLLDLYQNGHLRLDEMITRRYGLDQINEAYADMHSGINIRGVIDF